jgi:hypothetical protein
MRRLVRILAAAITGLLLLAAAPSTSSGAAARADIRCDDFYQPGAYYISVLNAPAGRTMVIGIDGASEADKAGAILANYDRNAPNQKWYARHCWYGDTLTYNYIQLQNQKSNKCLDKSEDTPNGNGNAVYQYRCSGHDQYNQPTGLPSNNQLWLRWPGGGDSGQWKHLINVAGAGCLDIRNESYVNGAYLVQWDCTPNQWDQTSSTQQWNAYP